MKYYLVINIVFKMFNKKDVSITTTKGSGPGGQHKNKTESCVVAIHNPTGIKVTIDGRNQHQNKKKALKKLEDKVRSYYDGLKAEEKKAERDRKIKESKYIRTYDYKSQTVKDHRTKRKYNLKDVLDGKINFWDYE